MARRWGGSRYYIGMCIEPISIHGATGCPARPASHLALSPATAPPLLYHPLHHGAMRPDVGGIGVNNERGEEMEMVTGIDGDISNAQKQLGGRMNATYRKISKTAGARPRMISDAIRHDLVDGISQFISRVGRILVGRTCTKQVLVGHHFYSTHCAVY